MLHSSSGILYMRASLSPLTKIMKACGGFQKYLENYINFNELIVPHFYGARPIWRRKPVTMPPTTTSGALGKIVAKYSGAYVSNHPTHAFAGIGDNIKQILQAHDHTKPCFYPLDVLADTSDFSMLLLGCIDQSPGFSTVHVAQHRLGLSQRHLLRMFMRWDISNDGSWSSIMAPESPGCSASFGKFYAYYEADGNLVSGEWHGVSWLFVPSARRALETEIQLLRKRGRFVDCGRWNCLSCRLRLY